MQDAVVVPSASKSPSRSRCRPRPPAVPPPTQTPAPGISWADSYQLKAGQCTTIHWNVQGVQGVYFYQEGQSWQNNGVTGKRTDRYARASSTTYYLRVVFTGGATETQERRINVEAPPPNLPVIARFDSNPQGQVVQGQCLDLYWDVQGAVDRVALWGAMAPRCGTTPRSAAPTMTARPTPAATLMSCRRGDRAAAQSSGR